MSTRSDSYPGALDMLPSGSWRWRVSVNGHRHQETWSDLGGEDDQEKAARRARETYDELADKVARGHTSSVPFSRFSKRYEREEVVKLAENSQRQYGIDLRSARAYFESCGDPDVADISKGDIKRFIAWRRVHTPDGGERDTPLSEATLRRAAGVLSALFTYAVDTDHRDANPVHQLSSLPKGSSREAYILDPEEYDALLAELEGRPMARTFALVVGETAMRTQSEAAWLRWEDIRWEEREIRVVTQRDGHKTKTDESRRIPMSARLAEGLREHARRFRFGQYGGEPSPWVFHHTTGHRDTKPGNRVKRFTHTLQEAADRAGIPDRWRPYDLRHMRLTRWGETGRAFLVMELAGHADISTTKRYVSPDNDALHQLVNGGADDEGRDAASDR